MLGHEPQDIKQGNAAPATEIVEGPPKTSSMSVAINSHVPDVRLTEPTFMEVFWAWEKLRVLYNVLLIALVVWRCVQSGFVPLISIVFLVDALLANICFCAGPVLEGYLTAAGASRKVVRQIIFWCGFVLTAYMANDWVPRALAPFNR